MANITVTVPDDFKQEMEEHPEINWSQVAREAFEDRIDRIETMEELEEITSKSELTEEDVEEISERIKRSLAEEYLGEEA
jgi:hypothetical protein